MKISNKTAVIGEDAACNYLVNKDYKILERNFRKAYGEIDIIALHGKTLVFVEVKTRTSNAFGTPFDSISQSKVYQITKGANYYKYVLHPELPDEMRIDAIGVEVWGDEVISLEHLENVTA